MDMNHNLEGLKLGGIRRYTALAKEVGGCIMLTLGEPEFDTPEPIRQAAKAAIDKGLSHYTMNIGDLELRKAISRFEETERGLHYAPEEIMVTMGATEAIYIAMAGILNPGDEVLIPTPAFSLYDTISRICGAVPVPIQTAEDGFQLTPAALEKAITPKTKLLILNSPNNPTGIVYSPETLEGLKTVAEKHDFFILSDDVYWGLGKCKTFSQFTELKDRILAVQSFSKPYAMTGWRIGYLMAPEKIINYLAPLHSHAVTCAPAMLQAACITALTCDPAPMAESYRSRRAYVLERLEKMGLPCFVPQGAFYVFPSLENLGMGSEEFCRRLITEGGVASVPGTIFGTEGYFRISYCCSMDDLREGMDRLERFVIKLTHSQE